jgi:predicted permease
MRFLWNRRETELEREVAHHIHELAAEYRRQGYSRDEAQRMAKREFGGPEQVKELCRDERRFAWMAGFRQDLVFSLRMMRRAPAITAAAVLSLALGIGANTAIISLMDVVLWRDLPVPEPSQLSLIHWQGQGFPQELADGASGSMWKDGDANVADFFSYRSYEKLRDGSAGRASVAAFVFPEQVSISFSGRPLVAQQRSVSGNFFSTLQVRPALGRVLLDGDDSQAAPPTAVLSYRFWKDSLGSDPAVVGKIIRVDNQIQTIVGVLPRDFYGLTPSDATDLYASLHHGARQQTPDGKSVLLNNRYWGFSLIGRSKSEIDKAHLQPFLNALFQASWEKPPKNLSTAPRVRLDEGQRGLGFLRSEFRSPLFVLGGLVTLLLVIACTNIVNLLLARALARQREIAARVALGCSRARLIRQFATESTLIAAFGGALAILIAFATANLLGQFIAARDGKPIAVALDFQILGFVGAISLVALLLFGVFPAVRGSNLSNITWGRPGASGLGNAPGHVWSAGRILVIAQTAMSVVLVLTAVIFIRNLLSYQSADPGFDRRNLVLFDLRPGTSGYDKVRLPSFYFNLEQRLATVPGVTGVGLASFRPMNVGGWWNTVRLHGQKDPADVSLNGVTPGYLPLFVSRMVSGRNITRNDVAEHSKVAVISEDLARKLGARTGQMLESTGGPPGAPPILYQIVGIAPAIAATSMKERPYVVWLPIENDRPELTIVVRTAIRPQAAVPGLRDAVAKQDRNLPLVEVTTMEEQIAKGLQRERMFATLCSCFGALALILSVVGLYGVISYNTSRRRSEIGVRLALGAKPKDVVSMVLKDGLALTVTGFLIAVPIVWWGTRYVEKSLSQAKLLQPVSLVLAALILFLAAFLAVSIPAVRAAGLDPAETLRQE